MLKKDVPTLCPVEIEAFERKADFPRVFHVDLLPAAPGTITSITSFLGRGLGVYGLRLAKVGSTLKSIIVQNFFRIVRAEENDSNIEHLAHTCRAFWSVGHKFPKRE